MTQRGTSGHRPRRRLHVQIWLAMVASLVAFALAAGLLWRAVLTVAPPSQSFELAAGIAQGALPAAAEPGPVQQAALERLSAHGRIAATLFAPDFTVIAAVGDTLPSPDPGGGASGWRWQGGGPPVWTLELPDGRWLVARLPDRRRGPPVLGLFFTLGTVAAALAVGAFFVARRLTRRLDRLQASVDALGAGDLTARVRVEGADEVAALAASFNRAAGRIETLVGAHKTLLANASHELRSPLARIRMAIEMIKTGAAPNLRIELERDIAELDLLIDEILLASRLDAVAALDVREEVDLLALAAEECARVDAELTGTPLVVHGDPRLLRRLLRNLLENAQRHGSPAEVSVAVRLADRDAVVSVCDRGPGVPDAERARIFEPFYRPAGSREREGGVGLGLALVRQIARKHGGDVTCAPRDGGGTCFEVRLGSGSTQADVGVPSAPG